MPNPQIFTWTKVWKRESFFCRDLITSRAKGWLLQKVAVACFNFSSPAPLNWDENPQVQKVKKKMNCRSNASMNNYLHSRRTLGDKTRFCVSQLMGRPMSFFLLFFYTNFEKIGVPSTNFNVQLPTLNDKLPQNILLLNISKPHF